MRLVVPALVTVTLALGGCSFVADVPLVGVPTNAPARPDPPGTYLPVHDIPPPRQEEVLSVSDQTRIESELSQARSKAKATAASDAAAIAASAPPPTRRERGKRAAKDASR